MNLLSWRTGSFLLVLIALAAGWMTFAVLLAQHNMVFDDRVVYRVATAPVATTALPALLHQTWKTTDLNESQLHSVASLKAAFPTYRHILWTDETIEAYAAQEFPAFYAETWPRITPFICKVDTWRYMVMHKMGGLYADIDTVGHRNAEHLWRDLPGYAFVPTRNSKVNWDHHTDAASPAYLFSYPGNDFWLSVLDYIRRVFADPHRAQTEEVIFKTGPGALSRVLLDIKNGVVAAPPQGLAFLSEARFGIGAFKDGSARYAFHENRHVETWRAPNARQ